MRHSAQLVSDVFGYRHESETNLTPDPGSDNNSTPIRRESPEARREESNVQPMAGQVPETIGTAVRSLAARRSLAERGTRNLEFPNLLLSFHQQNVIPKIGCFRG